MIRTVEKYEILGELGHGGMATVYRARDTRLDRMVALKILHPHLRAAAEARSRFTREAKSVAKLKHANILEIYDYSGEDSEESYIAAELLSGPTLKEFGARNPNMPAEIAACIGVQIARALATAHAHGIVHRDVKPENVLLCDERCIKLTDFGIAQMVDTQSFTATGQVLGSPGHMAPEQVESGVVDERSDLFALGTVLYYLACARLPFAGRNPHQVLRRVMDAEYADPLRVRPSIGADMARVIDGCLKLNPADRYQNADALADALLELLQSVGIDDPDQALADYIDDPERKTNELHAQVVTALTTTGAAKAEARDVPGAMDAFNRVLALDEGNEEVLRLIQRVGKRERRNTWLFLLAGVLGVVLLVWALAPGNTPHESSTTLTNLATDGGLPDSAALAVTMDQGAGLVVQADTGIDTDDGGPPAQNASNTADAAQHSPDNPHPTPRRPRGPRAVAFSPSPRNVSISVDGGPMRAFGPSFPGTTLPVGMHTFRVVAGEGVECCEDATIRREVVAGDGTQTIQLRLPLRPARLYVVASAPASVQVAGGGGAPGVTGRARSIINVPMRERSGARRITVTAEGHQVYTGSVRLSAGEVTQQRVQLVAQAPESPPP